MHAEQGCILIVVHVHGYAAFLLCRSLKAAVKNGTQVQILSLFTAGVSQVIDGDRAMTFNLSMLTEPQVFTQLAIRTPSPQYFQSVKHFHLYTYCSSCADNTELELLAHQTLLDGGNGNEWLKLTLECATCNWKKAGQVVLVLRQTDENDLPVAFTEETAAGLKSFLIIYTYEHISFPSQTLTKVLEKRQTDTRFEPRNRTTVEELRDSNVTCSRHDVILTSEEFPFQGQIIVPLNFSDGIRLTYCLGECSNPEFDSLSVNKTYSTFDSRTRALMYSLNNELPPCCIPNEIMALEMLVAHDNNVVQMGTFPQVVDCKCQL